MARGRSPRRSIDPRALVVAGSLLALIVIAMAATALVQLADEGRRSVRRVEVDVEVPLRHIGEVLDANVEAGTLLVRAAGATGAQRTELLSRTLAATQSATRSWTAYKASALHLPGEADLAARYERDFDAARSIKAEAIVSIVRQDLPMALPDEVIAAVETYRQDLIGLHSLYESEDEAILRSLDQQRVEERNAVLIGAGVLDVLVLFGLGLGLRIASRSVSERREQAALAELADLEARLIRALEFTDEDGDAFRVASRALTDVRPDAEVSIVVADTSLATFTPIVAAPSCGVDSVERCPACRAGAPLQFDDSGSLDTCPVLAAAESAPCAVTCVPVSVAGMQGAVVQLTGPVGTPPDMGGAVPLIVRRLGDRITTLRALAQFQLQASRDPLTGLLNRRSLEDAVRRLTADDTPYAVAFADLDHFKVVNDVRGHEAGDRALRGFATTLKATLRPDDLIGRWGGEEFVVVLPDCDQQQAIESMERVRRQLASVVLEGSNVTVSVGIAVRDSTEPFIRAVTRADQALHVAKATGRDRVEAWKPGLGSEAASATDP